MFLSKFNKFLADIFQNFQKWLSFGKIKYQMWLKLSWNYYFFSINFRRKITLLVKHKTCLCVRSYFYQGNKNILTTLSNFRFLKHKRVHLDQSSPRILHYLNRTFRLHSGWRSIKADPTISLVSLGFKSLTLRGI